MFYKSGFQSSDFLKIKTQQNQVCIFSVLKENPVLLREIKLSISIMCGASVANLFCCKISLASQFFGRVYGHFNLLLCSTMNTYPQSLVIKHQL